MKKIITEDGEEYYVDFTRGHLRCLYLNLYIREEKKINKVFTIGKTWFGKRKKETRNDVKEIYKKVEDYEFTCSWDRSIDDYHLDTIKTRINQCIIDYKKSNINRVNMENWDGYMGDEGTRKKEIMRDQKIKDLLKGDASKLEDFLNKE